ncbi:hypothetical protein ACJRO7_011355 [Eucalyptus globulus]|uniref:Protein kinase domain-containing protein n=1 Tax=Eucalyptus globulus TaxID=34317 RepID=A0ABD3LFQ7_EUCGL
MQMICLIICLFVANRDRSGQFLDSYDSKSLASDGCPQNWHGVMCSEVAVSGLIMLQSFSLSKNQLAGIVSEVSSSLDHLKWLDLHGNGFAGDVMKLLSVFCSIEYPDLSYNQLSISLDPVLGNSSFLSSIRFLNFSSNSLAGELFRTSGYPVGCVTSATLKKFNLSSDCRAWYCLYRALCHNRLEHALWQFIMNIELGKLCGRSSNSLTGAVPIQTSQFLRLTSFQISDNLVGGPLPQVLGTYPELKVIGVGEILVKSFEVDKLFPSYLIEWLSSTTLKVAFSIICLMNFKDVSYNNFSGIVPENLRRFHDSALHPGNSLLVSPYAPKSPEGPTAAKIALIADGLIALLCFLISCSRKQMEGEDLKENIWKIESNSSVAKVNVDLSYVERIDELVSSPISVLDGDLHLFDRSFIFTAGELSCAPGEVMGRGCHVTSCKAALHSGHVLVVRWLTEGIAKGRKDFTREFKKLGSIKLPNLVPLQGYYRRMDPRKLSPLSLDTRLQITVYMARCLNFLNNEKGIPHSNLRSTNILLEAPDFNVGGGSEMILPASDRSDISKTVF